MTPPVPIILVPGITASSLSDSYIIPPEVTWPDRTLFNWVIGLKKEYERISLHPDNLNYEVHQPARMTVGQVFKIAYGELIEELRDGLREHYGGVVPVFPFPYDWRHNLRYTEYALGNFIEEVIQRSRLLGKDQPFFRKCNSVNLVGHSMGGLVIAGYLARCVRYKQNPRVNRVATLATPFQGSYDAIVKTATGMGNLGMLAPSPRERKAARITPSLYHLLPSFDDSLDNKSVELLSRIEKLDKSSLTEKSWFNQKIWQKSIVNSIAEYIEQNAVEPGNKEDTRNTANKLFAQFLKEAKQYRKKIDSLDLSKVKMKRDQWLCIAGVNSNTRVNMPIQINQKEEPVFLIRRKDRKNLWVSGESAEERWLTGDGTVPLKGAIPKFLDSKNVVCVTPEDFENNEIGYSFLGLFGEFHGILPNMNLVHRLLIRHFTMREDKYQNTWGKPVPSSSDISNDIWEPPMSLRNES